MQTIPKLLRFIHQHKSNFKGEIQRWRTFPLLVTSCPELHSLAQWPKPLIETINTWHLKIRTHPFLCLTSNNSLEIIPDDLPWGPKGTVQVPVGDGNLWAPVTAWVSWWLLLICPRNQVSCYLLTHGVSLWLVRGEILWPGWFVCKIAGREPGYTSWLISAFTVIWPKQSKANEGGCNNNMGEAGDVGNMCRK